MDAPQYDKYRIDNVQFALSKLVVLADISLYLDFDARRKKELPLVGRMRTLVLRQDLILGLAVSALAAVERPITVASAKTADVANPYL